MSTMRILTAAAFATVFAVATASAQQTQRINGTIDKVEGNTLFIKAEGGPLTLKLADNAVIVGVMKASATDIKAGDYVATGGVPLPDGTQKAVELRIFPDAMRGQGDGHRPGWPGAPNGTMTNGAVGDAVTSVDGPVLTVKFKDGEKKIIVGPAVPVSRFVIGEKSELTAGKAINVAAATKNPDGTFSTARINVDRGGLLP
jgi:outer membrane lipoprotein SlyB